MTVASESITIKSLRISSKYVTIALFADIINRITKISGFAKFAMIAFSIEQTFQANSRIRITIPGIGMVPILTTVTWNAGSPGNLRVPEIIISAFGTPRSRIFRVTFANRFVCL